jgi:hypothetical protein
VTGLIMLVVSVLGAGVQAHLEYLGIMRQTATAGTTYLSLAGAARYIGVPVEVANFLPTAAILIGLAAVWLLRSRPGAAYIAAVITMIAGSPVVQITWFTILLGALAPIVWPMPAQGSIVSRDALGDSASPAGTSAGSAGAIGEA